MRVLSFLTKSLFVTLLGVLPFGVVANEVTLTVPLLVNTPVLDGRIGEWQQGPTTLSLAKVHTGVSLEIDQLELWAGHTATHIYFALRWPDATSDRQHKPYVWNDARQRYVVGSEREDRVALQFEMSGNYDVNWLSGNEFTADMWHWKSARSAPLGLAHDKMTIVSATKLTRAYKARSDLGADLYIQRPSDAGLPIYKAKRYGLKESKVMQKYHVNFKASGSVTDVKAKERWSQGFWTVEFSRLLDTGNEDDVVFRAGTDVLGSIAVFDRSGEDNHVVSQLIRYVIE